MKKIFFLFVLAFICSSSYAQLVTSSRVSVEKKPSAIWLDLGVGGFSGDVSNTGLGVDLGLRWNKPFSDNISWDIIKVKAETDTKNFTDLLMAQATTGIRGTTPNLFGNSSIFGAASVGYGYLFDPEEGGVCWEISAGINITPRFLIGVAYNNQAVNIDDYSMHVNYISLRLGINL